MMQYRDCPNSPTINQSTQSPTIESVLPRLGSVLQYGRVKISSTRMDVASGMVAKSPKIKPYFGCESLKRSGCAGNTLDLERTYNLKGICSLLVNTTLGLPTAIEARIGPYSRHCRNWSIRLPTTAPLRRNN